MKFAARNHAWMISLIVSCFVFQLATPAPASADGPGASGNSSDPTSAIAPRGQLRPLPWNGSADQLPGLSTTQVIVGAVVLAGVAIAVALLVQHASKSHHQAPAMPDSTQYAPEDSLRSEAMASGWYQPFPPSSGLAGGTSSWAPAQASGTGAEFWRAILPECGATARRASVIDAFPPRRPLRPVVSVGASE
jgi:hypothetical protein